MFLHEVRHGWRNLIAAMIGIGCGVANYTPLSSIFFSALEDDFGWSKATAAISLIAMPLTAAALPFAGWLVDRHGVRRVAATSALCTTLCYVALSRMNGSPTIFYAAIIALNTLGCATGPVAYTRLIVADFSAARGTALAVALLGIALSAIFLPPVLGTLVTQHGWRAAYLFMAALALAGSAGALILMQPRDAEMQAGRTEGATVRQALASIRFWILGLAMLAISIGTLGLVSQFRSVFVEKGLGAGSATLMISLLGGSVMASRLVVGRVLDLSSPTRWAALATIMAAIGAALMMPPSLSIGMAVVAVILVGCSAGAELDLMAFFCSRFFGLRNYSAIYGLLFAFHYTGIAIGGISYGILYDRLGHYDGGLIVTTVLLTIATGLFLLLGRLRSPTPDPLHGVHA